MKIKTVIKILIIVAVIWFIYRFKFIIHDVKRMITSEYKLAKNTFSSAISKDNDKPEEYSPRYKSKNNKPPKEDPSRYKSKNNKPRRKNNKTSSYKREEICRKVLEDHFDDYFPTVRPNFLKNPKTGRALELDGYNAGKNIAFEHNGKQHYVYPHIFHKSRESYLNSVERDHFKAHKCAELGINLITIAYNIPTKDIKDYILTQL